jgi:HK97 family phage major capsid protein
MIEMENIQDVLGAIKNQKELIGTRFDKTDKRFDDTNAKLTEYGTRLEEIEKTATQRKVSLPGVNEGKEQFWFSKAINAIITRDWSGAGYEKEVFDQARKKVMDTGTGSAGGFIVPTQVLVELIQQLKENSTVILSGATVLDGLTGSPVEIPKVTGGATANWIGETSTITASDLTLGLLSLVPKKCAALVKISNRLVSLSNPSVEAMIRRDIAEAIALKIDLAALRGSGVSNEPMGIKDTANVGNVAIGTNGGDFTFIIAHKMVTKVEAANGLKGSLGFIMHSNAKSRMMQERIKQFSAQTDGSYVNLPMTEAMLREHLGYNFQVSNQIPITLTKGSNDFVSEVYFGNWQEMMIGQWGGLEFKATQEAGTAFETDQTWIRALMEVDIGLRHPESFCIVEDAEAS